MENAGRIRILTVDDHPLLREGVASMINAEPDMQLVAEADSGAEAIKQFRSYRPDVTLMDLQMPGMNGVDAIKAICNEFKDARIIVLTEHQKRCGAQRGCDLDSRVPCPPCW